MGKIIKVDPLLEMLRQHAKEIKEMNEEDMKYFCTNWDLCRDKLLEITNLCFTAAEKVMHDFSKMNFEVFEDYFCSPFLLAEIIQKYFLNNYEIDFEGEIIPF